MTHHTPVLLRRFYLLFFNTNLVLFSSEIRVAVRELQVSRAADDADVAPGFERAIVASVAAAALPDNARMDTSIGFRASGERYESPHDDVGRATTDEAIEKTRDALSLTYIRRELVADAVDVSHHAKQHYFLHLFVSIVCLFCFFRTAV